MSKLDFDRSLAVVIGINLYGNGLSPLKTAVADASAIAQQLKQDHEYEVITLLDQDANLQALQTLIQQELPSRLTSNSRLLLYFAGHGIAQNGDNGPEGFLIPQDATPTNVASYLSMVELHDALAALVCRHFLAIFDCCFAGAFRWSSTRSIHPIYPVVHKERFDRFRQEPAWQVITSASYNQKAMDVLSLADNRGDQGQHSPFAAALLDAIAGAADTSPPAQAGKPAGDGVLTATELYMYLRDTVEPLTEDSAQRQTPEICALKKHRQGEFIFLTPGHELNLPPAPDLSKKNNPYLGLSSFSIKDADLFYGRQELTKELTQFVKENSFTAVLGPSGTGKSSLVKAGLIPQLQDDPEQTWQVLPVMRPGESPLKALAQVILSLEESNAQVHQIEALSAKFYEGSKALISKVLAWKKKHPKKQLLLVIDQFEEVVTLCRQNRVRQQFLELLVLATSTANRLGSIVITLRSDFEPQFLETALKPIWTSARFNVPPMSRDELRQVIEQPATKRVLYFEPPTLVNRLLDEVVQTPGALPLLSFTLSELYLRYLSRKSDNRALTESDYEDLGGIAGSLTQRATQEYQQLVQRDSCYQYTVRNVMLRMVALEGGELARRRVPEAELVYSAKEETQRVQTVLKTFTAARLLVKGQTATSQSYIEPAHDALVRGWTQLLRWQRSAQEEMLLRQPLDLAAADWKNKQGALWNKDSRLGLLQNILKSKNTWLNRVESEFVQRSTRLKRRNKVLSGAVLLGSVAFGVGMFALSEQAERARTEALESKSDAEEAKATAELRQQEATLREKSSRASTWVSEGRAAEGLLLSLETLSQSMGNSKYHESVLSNAQKSTRDTARLAPEINTLKEQDHVRAVATDPRYRYFASADRSGGLKLWDASNGKILSEKPQAHKGAIYDIAVDASGRFLASVGKDKKLRVWEIDDSDGNIQIISEPKHELDGHSKTIQAVDFSPSGDRLVSGGADKTIRLWNIETGKPIREISRGLYASILDVKFSPDGNTIASGSADSRIRLWDANTGLQVTPREMRHDDAVFSVAFDKAGNRIVSGSADRSVRMWNAKTGRPIEESMKGHNGKVYAALFSADGKTVISAGSDRTIRFWHAETATQIGQVLEAHRSLILDLALTGDKESGDNANQLISSSSDNTIRLWDIATDRPLGHPRISPHSKDVFSIAVSSDGKYAVSAGEDRQLAVWNAKTQALVRRLRLAHEQPIWSVAFRPSKPQFMSASNDGTLRLWNAKTGQLDWYSAPIRDKDGSTLEIYAVAFHPDGNFVASGGADKKIHLWNLQKEQQEFEWEAHKGPVLSIAFSPNGNYIATGGGDDKVVIWNRNTRKPIHSLVKHTKDVRTVAFSPDGQYLASGSVDRNIQLWQVETGKHIAEINAHTNEIASVSFNPKAPQLVSTSFDRTIRLWDIADIENPKLDGPPLVGHTQSVWDAQFTPDGKSIISASADLSLRWWPSRWQEWPKMACDRIKNHQLLQSSEGLQDIDEETIATIEIAKAACKDKF